MTLLGLRFSSLQQLFGGQAVIMMTFHSPLGSRLTAMIFSLSGSPDVLG